jgi:signal transduction histidine kinase
MLPDRTTPLDRRSLVHRLRATLAAAEATGAAVVERDLLASVLLAVEADEGQESRIDHRVAEARLEALRELAYGAGHEINNPLANIAARAQALLLDEREPERRRRLATIVDQAFRARDMIGGLMVFARPPKPEPADTPLDELLGPVVEMLRGHAASLGVSFVHLPPAGPIQLHVDRSQIAEALRMLGQNAIEATSAGGRVVLEARGATSGGGAEVTISDDGPGMDPETAERACDPFFSGREAGRGIGLGLPKTLRLVEANGGSLRILSRPGQGTQCVVTLPAARTAA